MTWAAACALPGGKLLLIGFPVNKTYTGLDNHGAELAVLVADSSFRYGIQSDG